MFYLANFFAKQNLFKEKILKIFTREIIESFSNPIKQESYAQAFNWLENYLPIVVEEIKKSKQIITEDYEIVLIGDLLFETSTPNSEIDVFLAFNSPQLELNSMKLSNDKFKRFWQKVKKAYSQAKEEKKSKRKRKKEKEKQEKIVEIPINKYTIINLKRELALVSSKTLAAGGAIYTQNSGIKIVAREALGVDINIYPAVKSEDGYKVFSESSGKFTEHKFEELKENLTKKLEEVGPVFLNLCRTFKNLYFNINNLTLPSPYLIESLIYNCPNNLFFGRNYYEVFIKILNYISNTSIQNFSLINNKQEKLSTSNLVTESIAQVYSFIRKIDEMI